ncbi:MAG TPA: AMP-binding protein [Solirubrobacteraceae bacterium]|jgi:acetyl-CoA synthetase|nr:AMP-binding protein [Solirubrobacteraceae bacterium]
MSTVDSTIAGWLARYGAERVNIAHLLCDAHPADSDALVFDGPDGVQRLTYGELAERSKRLAGALRQAGVGEGDRVATMMPKSVELVLALLAIWRVGGVHVPLFTAFGPDAAGYRIAHSGAQLVITDAGNREKVGDSAPVMCVADAAQQRQGDLDFAEAVESGPSIDGIERGGEELMFLLYTSGTTGQPKGVEVPVRALASIHSYMHYGLDVRPEDVFWNMADPGWAYGLWCGITGSLLLGQTVLLRAHPFDAQDVCAAILAHGVTNLTGAPTVYRSLRAAGVPEGFKERSHLRAISSGGEPLNAELLAWSARELGTEIHDHYGQSELGMVVSFAHHPELHRQPVPGSMGFPLPGLRVVVLDENGQELGPDIDGEVAIDVESSPLFWFRGYYEEPERTAERFRHGPRYYLTADTAHISEDGLLRFASRADDVISSSGYRIGPFEVESALIAHEAVAEVAVIGTPDELRGEAVTAFVVTAPGTEGTPALAEELQQFVRARLAKHLYPRHVCFLAELPRTPSGKIRRTVLRERWSSEHVGT